MTRKEAFNNRPMIEDMRQAHQVDAFIQKIYDDFESRTCGNCEHYEKSPSICWMRVEIDGYIGKDKDFGCNKFERKES